VVGAVAAEPPDLPVDEDEARNVTLRRNGSTEAADTEVRYRARSELCGRR
jgi:hypothetical protein